MANQSIFNAFERMWQHVVAKVGSKADLIHNHDDIYYTEDEVDAAINEIATSKADVDHNHNDVYETKDNAQLKLDQAKSYTDTKTSGLASTSSVTSAVSTHNTSTSAHNDIRELITGLTTRLNTLADSDDTTLDQMSEVVAYIKSNKSLIEDVTTNKVNVADIVNNLTTNVSNKPLSAAQGVAIKGLIDALEDVVEGKADEEHTHAIADVSGLQSALDGKAASSHGTHVSFDSTNKPKMDGTAAFGTSSKVARADHVHPTDTTRAAQASLDSHTGDTTVHITATERTNWNAAKTHADSAHAPSNAQVNVIESIKVNGTAQTITSKAVDITVPTKASDIGAASSSHGTHVTWSTTTPKANGTAAVGSETKVARGDHVHPTDTTRASQADLDALKDGGTFNDTTFTGYEENETHVSYFLGALNPGTAYADLDATYKDGTYHRLWRLRFPSNSKFWGRLKISLFGTYTGFNASGLMSKTITCNFTNSTMYNNVGRYDSLGYNVENDFRISEAIWNADVSAWEILIWQKNLNGNNSPRIIIDAWSSVAEYRNNVKNITAQPVELIQDTTYTATKASSTGGTKTVTWADKPVFETPYGEAVEVKGHSHNYYGVCTTAADTAAKTVEIEGFELVVGAMVIVKFDNANSASNPTLNVSGTGAKPMYRYGTTALSTGTTTTGWYADSIQLFVYDGTGWIRDYWNNTTYSNAGLGQGYGTCSTAAATVAKTASISSYALTAGGIVTIKFTNAVPAGATLNITSKGAKAIYYRGAAITANVIKAGDTATFIYSTYYYLLSIDRWQKDISSKAEIKLVEGETETTINEMVINKFDSKTDYETALANGEVVEGDFCSYPEEYDASDVNITTINGISATNVQDAINELNSKKATVHYGTSEPSSSFGAVGDLYIIYED